MIHALIMGHPYVIVGLYLPPPGDGQLLIDIMNVAIAYGVDNIIVTGYFNMVPSAVLDSGIHFGVYLICPSGREHLV